MLKGTASHGRVIELHSTPPLLGGEASYSTIATGANEWQLALGSLQSSGSIRYTLTLQEREPTPHFSHDGSRNHERDSEQGARRQEYATTSPGDLGLVISSFTAYNVSVGDVYFCSGQSNMERGVNDVYDVEYWQEDATNFTQIIRLWRVPYPTAPGLSHPNGSFIRDNCAVEGDCTPDNTSMQRNSRVSHWVPVTADNVLFFSSPCYFTARAISRGLTGQRPIGLVVSAVGGTPIQSWLPTDTFNTCRLPNDTIICDPEVEGQCNDQPWDLPSGLYNAMVFPLISLPVRAILWWQGEANTNEGYSSTQSEYTCMLQQLVLSWRSLWRRENLPFLVVQLQPWLGNAGFSQPWNPAWSDVTSRIRVAQAQAVENLSLRDHHSNGRSVGKLVSDSSVQVAVIFDIGDAAAAPSGGGGLHPKNKEQISERLAAHLFNMTFARGAAPAYPIPVLARKFAQDDDLFTIELQLQNAEGLQIVPTRSCEYIYDGTCCGANGTTANVAMFVVGSDMNDASYNPLYTDDDGISWNLANTVQIHSLNISGSEGFLHLTARIPSASNISYLHYGLADYATCSVNNRDLPLGPFSYMSIQQ